MGNVCVGTLEETRYDTSRGKNSIQVDFHDIEGVSDEVICWRPDSCHPRLPGEGSPLPVIKEEEVLATNLSPRSFTSKEQQDINHDGLHEEVPCPTLLGRVKDDQEVPAFMPGPAWKSAARDSTFLGAQAAAKAARGICSEDRLRLYALQKQATVGSVRGPQPSLFEFRARTKWRAWAKLCSMDKELAKKEYCLLVDSLVPGWKEDAQLGERFQ